MGPSLDPKGPETSEELAHLALGVAEPAVVGDRSGELETEPEVVGRLFPPPGHRRRVGKRVEGGVALDRSAPGRIGRELLARASGVREERPHPSAVGPHGAAHVHSSDHAPTLGSSADRRTRAAAASTVRVSTPLRPGRLGPMFTERQRSERRRAVGALLACAAALAITVSATAGVTGDELAPSLSPGLPSIAD